MPSWNIHTAHVERLLAEESSDALGIRDLNCFLFGNFVPDIYVGWMVPDISHKLLYTETHLAEHAPIPVPRHEEFWDRYIGGHEADEVSDVTLGAWAHLVCDAGYNGATRAYIASIGVKPGDETRIRKQGDFELYGRTHLLSLSVSLTDELVRECAVFPQYPIAAEDVRKTVEAADGIVEGNNAQHLDKTPSYSLLTPQFFRETGNKVDADLRRGLELFAHGGKVPYAS